MFIIGASSHLEPLARNFFLCCVVRGDDDTLPAVSQEWGVGDGGNPTDSDFPACFSAKPALAHDSVRASAPCQMQHGAPACFGLRRFFRQCCISFQDVDPRWCAAYGFMRVRCVWSPSSPTFPEVLVMCSGAQDDSSREPRGPTPCFSKTLVHLGWSSGVFLSEYHMTEVAPISDVRSVLLLSAVCVLPLAFGAVRCAWRVLVQLGATRDVQVNVTS